MSIARLVTPCHSPIGGEREADIVKNLVEQGDVSMVDDPEVRKLV
jgi:hypothetical protein